MGSVFGGQRRRLTASTYRQRRNNGIEQREKWEGRNPGEAQDASVIPAMTCQADCAQYERLPGMRTLNGEGETV
jgi:hypothetical protein